jgi:hypothetical protein
MYSSAPFHQGFLDAFAHLPAQQVLNFRLFDADDPPGVPGHRLFFF